MFPLMFIALMSANYASAGTPALLKAVTGDKKLYAREYIYDGDAIKFVHCSSGKRDFVNRSEYVVMESEDVCTVTSFQDQKAYLEALFAKLKSDQKVNSVVVELPNLNKKSEAVSLNELTKTVSKPTHFSEGNAFNVRVILNKSNVIYSDETAKQYLENKYQDVNLRFVSPAVQDREK